jgi:hypothetical protein
MANVNEKRHLRLVNHFSSVEVKVDTSAEKSGATSNTGSEKVALFLLREVDLLRTSSFAGFLCEKEARLIFDCRVAPRLDFIAPSRMLAFRKFSEIGVDYIDIVGAMGLGDGSAGASKPEEWVDLVFDKINAVAHRSFGAVFIFDNDSVLSRAYNVLPTALGNLFRNSGLKFEVVLTDVSERIAM